MDLTYQPSIAGLTIGSIFKQIQNSAEIESLMYQMNSQNSELYVDIATQTKNYTVAAGRDEAKGMLGSAICSLVGAGVDLATTAAVTYYSTLDANPSTPDTGKSTIPAVKVVAESVDKPDVVSDVKSASPSEITGPGRGIVTGRNTNDTSVQEKTTARQTNKTNEEKAEIAKKAKLQKIQMLGDCASKTVNGIGGIIKANYTDLEAHDKGQGSLYGALVTVFQNTQGAITGSIQIDEEAKKAAVHLAEAIISANAGIRG